MEIFKIIVAVVLMVQMSIGLPISTSLTEENINAEDITNPLEESKNPYPETVEIAEPFKDSKNPLLDQEPKQQSSDEEKMKQPLQLKKDFSKDFRNLPLSDPKEILSSLPDVEQMQRDQLLSLAMAQLMQYTRWLMKQTESKFSDILTDLGYLDNADNATPDVFAKPKENIENYLQQLKDYKKDTTLFMTRTIDMPLQFQTILSQLKVNAVDNFELQQILQQNNLNDFEEDLKNYFENVNKMFRQEFDRLAKDLNAVKEETEDKVKQLIQSLISEDGVKMQLEKFSELFKIF